MTMMQALMALDDESLGEVFRLRPDLASPVPAGFAELADRASRVRSLQAAYAGLDSFTGLVLQACCVVEGGSKPAAVVGLLGGPGRCPPEALEAALDRLAARALLWRGDGGAIHPAPALHAAFGYPLGLGRPLSALVAKGQTTIDQLQRALVLLGLPGKQPGERKGDLVARLAGALADRDLVGSALAAGPAAVRQLVDRLAGGRPTIPVQPSYGRGRPSGSPHEWLLERLLIVRLDWYEAEMPREAALALRGGEAGVAELAWARPAVAATAPEAATVRAAARAAAAEAVRVTEALLERWSASPPAALKAGGIGVRDLKRAGGAAGCPEADVGLFAEVAAAAGLLRQVGDRFLPTADYDTWRAGDPAQRWLRLATGWLAAGRIPSLAGERDADDKPIAALNPKFAVRPAIDLRAAVLAALGEHAGAAPESKSLAAALVWDRPVMWERFPLDPYTATDMVLREAALLGITGAGALSPWGAELVAGRYDAAALIAAEVLGRNETVVTVQADLTAVAGGPVGAELGAELALMADVESRGAATVWRFSDRSLGRAFDAGRSAEDILGFLAAHAPKGVPQTLEYLVGDVARRHGRIRAGTVRSYVRADDPAVVAEVCGAKKLRRCGLRPVAPMVAVAAVDAATLVAALREAGFLAVEEAADGATVVRAPARNRAAPAGASGRSRPGRGSRNLRAGRPREGGPPPQDGMAFWVVAGEADRPADEIDVVGLVHTLRTAGPGPARPPRRDPRTGRIIGAVPMRSVDLDDFDDLDDDFYGYADDDDLGFNPHCDCPECLEAAAEFVLAHDVALEALDGLVEEPSFGETAERIGQLESACRDGRRLLIAYDHPRRGRNADVCTVLRVTGTTVHLQESSGREQLVDLEWIEAILETGGGPSRRRRGRP